MLVVRRLSGLVVACWCLRKGLERVWVCRGCLVPAWCSGLALRAKGTRFARTGSFSFPALIGAPNGLHEHAGHGSWLVSAGNDDPPSEELGAVTAGFFTRGV
ncbi:hypothetical protein D3C74_268550 [compost metagenome]